MIYVSGIKLSDLTPMQQRVFLLLTRLENHKTHEFFHSDIYIAKKLKASTKSVARAKKVLVTKGIIKYMGKASRSKKYQILDFLDI